MCPANGPLRKYQVSSTSLHCVFSQNKYYGTRLWLHFFLPWPSFPPPATTIMLPFFSLCLLQPILDLRSTLIALSVSSSQSPSATLQSTNTQTQSSSSSSGDGSLFRQRGSQAAQPDETGRVPPYVDFTQFYSLWGSDHSDGQSAQAGLGPQWQGHSC